MLIKKQKLWRLAKTYAIMQESKSKLIKFKLDDEFIIKLQDILETQIEQTVKETVEKCVPSAYANRRKTIMIKDMDGFNG